MKSICFCVSRSLSSQSYRIFLLVSPFLSPPLLLRSLFQTCQLPFAASVRGFHVFEMWKWYKVSSRGTNRKLFIISIIQAKSLSQPSTHTLHFKLLPAVSQVFTGLYRQIKWWVKREVCDNWKAPHVHLWAKNYFWFLFLVGHIHQTTYMMMHFMKLLIRDRLTHILVQSDLWSL